MMNSTTSISLNDRFSIINSKPETPGRTRARSRSRSRQRSAGPQRGLVHGSAKSKQFISMLDKKHQLLSLAKKLKNKSLVAARKRNQAKNVIRRPVNAAQRRRLKRNSLSNNNNFSVKDRLGIPRQSRSRFRRSQIPPQQQQQPQVRGRSRSRSRMAMARSNSQSNLRRSNSQSNLKQPQQQRVRLNRNNFRRSNSRSNLNRSNSRGNLSRANSRQNLSRANSRQNLSRANSRQNLSVNNRLGANKTAPLRRAIRRFGNQLNAPRASGIIRGRTTQMKRRNPNSNNAKQIARKFKGNLRNVMNGGNNISNNNRGRQLKRNQGGQMRGRSLSRNRAGNQQQQNQNNRGRQQQRPFSGNNRRGRSRNRNQNQNSRRGGARPQQNGIKKEVTKEMLDKQLDQYMQSSS